MAAPEAACRGSVSAMKSQDTCLDGAVTTGAAAAAAAGIPAVASLESGCASPAERLALRAVGICPECVSLGAQGLGK